MRKVLTLILLSLVIAPFGASAQGRGPSTRVEVSYKNEANAAGGFLKDGNCSQPARTSKLGVRDPFYVTLERNYNYYKCVLASGFLVFGAGVGTELILGGSALSALQFGLSLLVWGVFLRTVLVWHQTWAVNSLGHLWGYRNYATQEASKNNLFVGYFSNGEGWHNNHHAFPSAAKHGHRWWELDVTFLVIRILAAFGLASEIVLPNIPPPKAQQKT